jgi:iron complex outermembrane receptor protein
MAGVAGAALFGYPAAAVAQTASAEAAEQGPAPQEAAPQTAAPPSEEAPSRDVVLVTAQKREERLIDVPMSLSAVSGDTLVEAGIVGTAGLAQTTPGIVTVNNGFGFLPAIRGIQSSGTSPGDALNVAIYLDDVIVGAPIAGIFDLSDIERVEVLKGPQGTLFGRNATGGAIRIVTRTPSFTPEGNVSADYGFNFDEVKLNGYLTGGITDKLAGSLSVTMRKGDGFIEGIGPNGGRTYGKPDNNVIRGKLLFQPTDTFRAVLSLDNWQQQNDSVFISMVNNTGTNPFPGSIPNGLGTYASGTQPKARLGGNGATLDATWELGDITLRSISGARHVEVQSTSDTDRTNLPISWNAISQYEDALSQEFTVSGPVNKPLEWMVGAYYFNALAGNPYFKQGTGDGNNGDPLRSVTAINAAGAAIGPSAVTSNFTNKVRTEATAAFGELTWNATDDLHITGGLRYSSESKDFRYWATCCAATLATLDTGKTWDSTTWRAVARYDLGEDANVYGSVSTGFKSGVFNAYAPINNPINPEKVTAYEIGAKAYLGGIDYTAAVYQYDYEDIQLSAYVSVNGTLLVSLSNAATAKMQGVEFTASGDIGAGFSFNAGVSYQPKSDYTEYPGAQVTVPVPGATGPINKQVVVPYNASDTRTVRTPETTANFRLNYNDTVLGGDFLATVNAAYTSEFFWQPGEFSAEPAYTVVNGRVSWTDPVRNVTYSVFGNNLTDEEYRTDFVANLRGDDSVKIPAGREIGIGVSVDF